MNETELNFKHDGLNYTVLIEYNTKTVDDSFDGHLGGYVHTFKSSHEEVDLDTVNIIFCINENEEEVDPDDINGLNETIEYHISEISL